MSTKKTTNAVYFYLASAVTVVVGYFLSIGAASLYDAKFKTVHLPLGDTLLILGAMYFAIVVLVGALIAYFYAKSRLI